jgi:hypothetical protein
MVRIWALRRSLMKTHTLATRTENPPMMAGLRDHGHVRQLVGGHERLDDREHGLGLGLVALEPLPGNPNGKVLKTPLRKADFGAPVSG